MVTMGRDIRLTSLNCKVIPNAEPHDWKPPVFNLGVKPVKRFSRYAVSVSELKLAHGATTTLEETTSI